MQHGDYDVTVIGGGPAGLMACVGAVQQGARVLLIEKGDRLGRKLIISGGGRCNVTNNKDRAEMVAQIPGNGRFMHNALHQFGSQEIIAFFESLGVALKEEDHGRMFPVTDQAITVANTLIAYLQAHGVTVRLNAPVAGLDYASARVQGVRLASSQFLDAAAVVVAVGGKSVPRTGSTGDGYAWAQAAGHTITHLYPTEAPLTSDAPWIQTRVLQGLSLQDVALTLYDGRGKRLTTQQGDMIFTHFGVSGPAALRLAHYVEVARQAGTDQGLTLAIDLVPAQSPEASYQEFRDLAQAQPNKALKNLVKGLFPARMIPLILANAGLAEDQLAGHLKKGQCQALAQVRHRFALPIRGTRSLEEAFVTGGGVSIKEIEPRTMASKLITGLYFAGEIMDVHAHTGGYNITIAFASGYVAGRAAAGYVQALKSAAALPNNP